MRIQFNTNALHSGNLNGNLEQNTPVSRTKIKEGITSLKIQFTNKTRHEISVQRLGAEVLPARLAVGLAEHVAVADRLLHDLLELVADARSSRTVKTSRIVRNVMDRLTVGNVSRAKSSLLMGMLTMIDVGSFLVVLLLLGHVTAEDGRGIMRDIAKIRVIL